MESVCIGSSRTSRRKSKRTVEKSVRETESTDRREMVRVGDDGLQMCRHPSVLLQPDCPRAETYKDGDRTTHRRMEHAEVSHSADLSKLSRDSASPDVFISTRPLQPGRRMVVHGMQSFHDGRNVLFNDIVTVYEPVDWSPEEYRNARRGENWMQAAADRDRFKRRINQSETELGNIFSAQKIFNRLCFCK